MWVDSCKNVARGGVKACSGGVEKGGGDGSGTCAEVVFVVPVWDDLARGDNRACDLYGCRPCTKD